MGEEREGGRGEEGERGCKRVKGDRGRGVREGKEDELGGKESESNAQYIKYIMTSSA